MKVPDRFLGLLRQERSLQPLPANSMTMTTLLQVFEKNVQLLLTSRYHSAGACSLRSISKLREERGTAAIKRLREVGVEDDVCIRLGKNCFQSLELCYKLLASAGASFQSSPN